MDDALRRVLVAELRRRGFTGSLPHLRRRADDRISLLSVQHFSGGGSFVVEVAVCPTSGHVTSWGAEVGPSVVTARHINHPRPRLGSASFPAAGDHWFVYGPRNHDVEDRTVQPDAHYADVAERVVAHLDDAEAFWATTPLGR